MGVPLRHLCGVPGGDVRLQLRIGRLQGRVATAMVAVQMGVEQQIERAVLQGRLHQRQGLRGVQAVAAVNQRGTALALDQDVVAGQPAALKNLQAGGPSHEVLRHASSQCALDDDFLHVAGALVNLADAHIAVNAFNRKVADIAIAA